MNTRDARYRFRVAERRVRATKLYLQGYTAKQVGEFLGVSKATAVKDLLAVRAEWRTDRVETYLELLGTQLASIRLRKQEAWEAWERSKRATTRTKIDEDGQEVTTTTTAGDPRFLDAIARCDDDIARIHGLYAATKVEGQVGVGIGVGIEVRVIEDGDWFGNNAHALTAESAPAPSTDLALASSHEGNGVRPAVGQNGGGTGGGH